MKVVEITLRTPGIFLNESHADSAPSLSLWVRKHQPEEGDWSEINSTPGIQVLTGSVEVPSIAGSIIPSGSVRVPRQDEGIMKYSLLMQDGETWEYRVSARPCLDCERIFSSRGEESRIWQNGVVVGSGSIKS